MEGRRGGRRESRDARRVSAGADSFFFFFLAFVLGEGGLGSGMLMIFWEWWKKIAERGGGGQYGRRDVRRVHGQGLGTALLDELGRYPSVRRRR